MKKLTLFIVLFCSLVIYGQNTTKYLTEADSVLSFVAMYDRLEITVVDTGAVDTLLLEKVSFGTTYAPVATFSLASGAYVATMIPGGSGVADIYIIEVGGTGSYQLRMTDTAEGTVAAVKIKVVGVKK